MAAEVPAIAAAGINAGKAVNSSAAAALRDKVRKVTIFSFLKGVWCNNAHAALGFQEKFDMARNGILETVFDSVIPGAAGRRGGFDADGAHAKRNNGC